MDMVRDLAKRSLYPLAVGGTETGKVQRRKAGQSGEKGLEVDVVHRPRVWRASSSTRRKLHTLQKMLLFHTFFAPVLSSGPSIQGMSSTDL